MLSIDIVSDVICPWCFIGHKKLEQALEAFPEPIETKVVFHPFLLDPSIPPEGADLRQRLRAKYGADPEAMFERVEAAARSVGLAVDFAKVRRTPPTLPSHTLIRHALEKGTQRALVDALFRAYFMESKDLGDVAVLSSIAAEHGFAPAEATRLATDKAELDETRAEANAMAARGIHGVPFFVFGGKVAVEGAQSPETLRGAMAKAMAGGTSAGS
jgi:predicted DsbA family dithiol-disulfide isomerase